MRCGGGCSSKLAQDPQTLALLVQDGRQKYSMRKYSMRRNHPRRDGQTVSVRKIMRRILQEQD